MIKEKAVFFSTPYLKHMYIYAYHCEYIHKTLYIYILRIYVYFSLLYVFTPSATLKILKSTNYFPPIFEDP